MIDARDFGQRPHDELPRDAHAKAAADQLRQQKALAPVQLVPVAQKLVAQLGRVRAAQSQHAFLDPLREPERRFARRRRQHMRDGFREIADRLIRLLEKPLRQARALAGEFAEQARGHRLARLAAREKIRRPRRIFGLRAGEIRDQRFEFFVGRCGRIERGVERREALHGDRRSSRCRASASTASSPYSVLNAPASRPCSRSQRTIGSIWPCVTITRCAPVAPIASCRPGQSA